MKPPTGEVREAGGPPAGMAAVHRTAAISVRELTKSYTRRSASAGRPALDTVDLDVRRGEFLVLLGPSGCGKTTLLRSIAGLEQPEGGSIRIEGEVVFDAARRIDHDPARRPVSMIFQSYALWPHMTAAKNVAFALRCQGVRRADVPRRVAEILDKLGIGHLADRHPGRMSGGQQQRLALARALVVSQRVVLFDEPLSNVDAQVREKLRLELIRMQRTLGFTAIYVTHDQAEAMELADRIAVMREGRIVQLDEPRTLYEHPQDVHVARFLGQSNELPFQVERVDLAAGTVSGQGALGAVTATWPPGTDRPPPVPGEQLVAFGRPGDFTAAAAPEGGSGGGAPDNHWLGRLEAVRFVGSHLEHVVEIGRHRLRCLAAADSADTLAEGSPVTVSIATANLRAMREPAAGGGQAA